MLPGYRLVVPVTRVLTPDSLSVAFAALRPFATVQSPYPVSKQSHAAEGQEGRFRLAGRESVRGRVR